MDANHCPGAVCILFIFPNGKRVLHTGDFRWTDSLLYKSKYYELISHHAKINKNLTVYLDTTYTFPKQDFILQKVIETAESHLYPSNLINPNDLVNNSVLFIVGAYCIGKERVYMSIAEHLGIKVHVDKTRWKSLLCFDWKSEEHAKLSTDLAVPGVIRNFPSLTHSKAAILVVNMNQLNFVSIEKIIENISLKTKQSFTKVVAFQPTGWTHNSSSDKKSQNKSENNAFQSREKGKIVIYSVSYSEHSSFTELLEFIATFKPQIIIPTVGTSSEKSEAQVKLLRQHSKNVYNMTNNFDHDEILNKRKYVSEF